MIDPIIAIMAIIGIGGGFAGLWWGWLVGEREADHRRFAFQLRGISSALEATGIGFKKMLAEFEALTVSAMQFTTAMEAAKPKREPWRDRFHWMDDPPPWSRGRERIGEYNHRKLLAYGIDDGIDYRGGLLDPSGGPQEGGAGGLPADVPADAVGVDPPGDVPGPGTAPPHTEE